MNNRLAVIMPVWIQNEETLSLTEAAIDSLGDVYMVVVDNASTIGREYLQDMSDKYIRNEENLGYAKAVNQGLRHLQEEHPELSLIAIANNDIRVSPNWQEVAQEVLVDPKVYSLHFRMIPYDQLFDNGMEVFTSGRERWCSGSFFVIDASKGMEFYDDAFFNSYDDWDYQYRIRAKGLQTAYTNKAEYQHMDSFTQQQIPERVENEKKNAELFKTKHGGYAEELFIKMYPDQMKLPWKPMP